MQMTWDQWSSVSEGRTVPGGTITAVPLAQHPGRFALFLADPGGGVFTTSGSAAGGWAPWSSVSQGATTPGAPVTAVELIHRRGRFALFLADPGGGVFTTSGNAAGGWAPWSSVSQGATTPGASITAARIGTASLPQTRFALFLADPGGGVFTTSGSPEDGWGGWSSVSQGATTPGAPVTAVPFGTRRDRFALFVADPGGGVFTTSGNAEGGWDGWSSVPGIQTVPGAPVTAVEVPVFPGRLALFLADTNGRIFMTSGQVRGRWDAWSSVSEGQATPGAPVAVGTIPNVAAGMAVSVADPGGGVFTTSGRLARPTRPTDLQVTEVADRRIGVAWVDRSDNEDGFRVRFGGKRVKFGDHTGIKAVGRNAESAVLTGLRSGYDYTISVVAFNPGGQSPSSNEVRATTPARQISVASEGTGASTVFTVTGAGFTPNGLVVIRITDSAFQQQQFTQTAGGDGKFVSRHGVACTSGVTFTFTAFEGADPDGTFANDIVTTCP